MSKFKKGDKVRCLHDYEGIFSNIKEFTKGNIYTARDDSDEYMVYVEKDDNGIQNGYGINYFEVVSTSGTRKTTLPTDSETRKNIPMLKGCLGYFPAALAGVANTSKLGNDKHNPGEDLHHARGKSTDQGDCILRHLMDVQDLLAAHERFQDVKVDDILIEVNQLAWRALAFSQEIHEMFGAPLAPGARLPESKK